MNNIDDTTKKLPLAALKIDRSGLNKYRRKLVFRYLLYGFLIVAVLLSVSWGVRKFVSGKIPVKVEIVRLLQKDEGLVVLNASGYVKSERLATVSAKITGRVDKIYAVEGQYVKAGDILAKLDDNDLQAASRLSQERLKLSEKSILETEVRLVQAKKDYERLEDLYKDEYVPLDKAEQAKTAVQSLEALLQVQKQEIELAKADLNLANTNIENSVVKAPFDGVVISKDAMEGEIVSPITAGDGFTRTGIATIANMDSLYIEADINESYLERIHEGQKVRIVPEAYSNIQYKGFVQKIIPAINKQKATFKIKIAFENRDQKILTDMSVKLELLKTESESVNQVRKVLIKRDGIMEKDGITFVYIVVDNKAKKQPITEGDNLGGEVEVTKGLAGGETIIISAPANLEDESPVEITE